MNGSKCQEVIDKDLIIHQNGFQFMLFPLRFKKIIKTLLYLLFKQISSI